MSLTEHTRLVRNHSLRQAEVLNLLIGTTEGLRHSTIVLPYVSVSCLNRQTVSEN